eukprot:2674854-Amphidinium_carterae.1
MVKTPSCHGCRPDSPERAHPNLIGTHRREQLDYLAHLLEFAGIVQRASARSSLVLHFIPRSRTASPSEHDQ